MNKSSFFHLVIFCIYFQSFGQSKVETLGNIHESMPYKVMNNDKAKGLDFTVRYFENWLASSGDRPNIPIKFETIISNLAFTCFVQILDLKSTVSGNEKKLVYQDLLDDLKENPKISLENIFNDIGIDGISGIKYIYCHKLKRINTEFYCKCSNYAIIYENFMLTIVYKICGSIDDIPNINLVFKNNINIIDHLAGRFVLDSQYY